MFIDTFKQPEDVDLTARMVYTMTHAGRATFFTSLTSACAFAANAVSEIPALYDFGVLTALIVVANYLMCITMTPCILSLWWRFVYPAERWLSRCIMAPCRRKRLRGHPADEGQDEVYDMSEMKPSTGFDVSKVKFDVVLADNAWGGGSGWGETSLRGRGPEDRTKIVVNTAPVDDGKVLDYEKGVLHKFLANVWAPLVLKTRWFIFLCIWMLLGVCIWQAVSIAPATSPPQFFPPGSNMAFVQAMTER